MFDELIGNERIKDVLKRMLQSGRLPGAMLFTGEDGIGKKLFALEIARALNCRFPIGVEGCGKCPACVRISKFNFPQSEESDDWKRIIWSDHPDVGIVMAPKRVLLVDQMRQIEAEANFRPYEGQARVFLIDEADKLNDSSANALLKVLEEPPHTSHIVLLTSRPAMLLSTVRSRCQILRFAPLSAKEIEPYLISKGSAPAAARVGARLARGSLGRALEQDLDEFLEQREAMLGVLRGLVLSDDRIQLLKSAEDLNSAAIKDEYETRLDILETLIRDAWMLSLGAAAEFVVNDDLLPELQKISKRLDSRRPARWISLIEEMREQLIVNINRKAATDSLFLTMATTTALPPRRRFLIK